MFVFKLLIGVRASVRTTQQPRAVGTELFPRDCLACCFGMCHCTVPAIRASLSEHVGSVAFGGRGGAVLPCPGGEACPPFLMLEPVTQVVAVADHWWSFPSPQLSVAFERHQVALCSCFQGRGCVCTSM
ncbi:hypothetical protein HJG60_011600 [Phyllostomus discolor]|uniref:Uncharacterized protein n=1 Tax=Phyllostomus discolor TaxID=89673 RepID=A0A833ZYC7_9CHIR|nr:hypothetical protein HJG60_011600 [Phyllostomus discolor]